MQENFNPHTDVACKDNDFDGITRPKDLEQFTGQDKIVENLKIFIQAAKMREWK